MYEIKNNYQDIVDVSNLYQELGWNRVNLSEVELEKMC